MRHIFTARIYKQGINPCVDVPPEVSTALGERGPIPVQGRLNGYPIRATLMPKGEGLYRLYIMPSPSSSPPSPPPPRQ